MIKFEKITYDQYKKDTIGNDFQYSLFEDENKKEYDDIILPKRSTKYSAGYDFFAPREVTIQPGEDIAIYTGIRAIMPGALFLAIHVRSSLGIKYNVNLANCTAIIDADYRNAKNQGHIILKLVNYGSQPVTIPKGKAFAQGIFTIYHVTDDDMAAAERTGGIGSTDS